MERLFFSLEGLGDWTGFKHFVGVGVPAWLSDIVIYIVGLVLVW